MTLMKKVFLLLLALCSLLPSAARQSEPVVVAYVTSWTRIMPDPSVMTHINYAFGHVRDDFRGVRIDNEERLRAIIALKKQRPQLRVMLSIGGWGSGRFSEMAASDEHRTAFAADCRRLCDELGLDGIDIDWEYPTQSSAGISASPSDTEHFTLLMRDLRQALGSDLLLTLASVGSAHYIDFGSCIPYLDMVNVMAYDMGNAPNHNAALYRSERVGWLCASEAVEAHRKAGIPDDKIVMGLPFYGRGEKGKYMNYAQCDTLREQACWDEEAQVPYFVDKSGKMVLGFENPRSIAAKCAYIRQQGLRGAMYWEYADDNEAGDLRRALWQGILQSDKERNEACAAAAGRLAATLLENKKREEITPDSFFCDWRSLKATMQAEQDPTAQAIYRAAMAHLLCKNRWRSQSMHRATESHSDSIQEWSHEEYAAHAAALYAKALQDMEALHSVSLKPLKALARSGKDDAVYGNDALHLIWQSACNELDEEAFSRHSLPTPNDIIGVYRRHGLREAALLLSLAAAQDTAALYRLKDEYADIPACASVYLQLANHPDVPVAEQYRLCEDAIRRYPQSRYVSDLKNAMTLMRAPQFSAKLSEMFYPHHDYTIPVRIKNMQTANIKVYRLPERTLVQTISVPVSSVDPLEEMQDSVVWKTPGYGRYALVLDGTTREKLRKGYRPDTIRVGISALSHMETVMPDGTTRVMVVDALSGEPQSGVNVTFYEQPVWNLKLVCEAVTDRRGIVQTTATETSQLRFRLSRGEDTAHELHSLSRHMKPGNRTEEEVQRLNLYTDRAIYRPGQTVYVSGIAQTVRHDDGKKAAEGMSYTLTCRDVNRKEVAKRTLTTDDFGTFCDSIQLPEQALPGFYTIAADGHVTSFRVEAYRRPTFQVNMDKPLPVSLPTDSITLTGRAVTYSQWPLANARVTGTYSLTQNWWLRHPGRFRSQSIDTLWTDSNGCFSVRVPIDATADELKAGQTLTLAVDVLSPEGETQTGSVSMPLCTEPLRMSATVGPQQNRESPSPWRFDLYASNGQTVDGNVTCTILQQGTTQATFTLKANRDTIPTLDKLPSGHYDLVAKADVKGDTAGVCTSFTLFSITDRKLQGSHDLWLYTPCDSISPERPARFQIGTTLPEAWIYCIIIGEKGVERDTVLHLGNEAVMMEVPYKDTFQHHLTVNAMLMHDGEHAAKNISFTRIMPDERLRMHWDTFRDHTQPGAKEHWRLTLLRPDGTPASANVMVGLYDAALDALAPYSMHLSLPECYNRAFLHVGWFRKFAQNRHFTNLHLPLRLLNTFGMEFARWREDLFPNTFYAGRGGKLYATQNMKMSRSLLDFAAPTMATMKEEAVAEAEDADVVSALEGAAAGIATGATPVQDVVPVRENLAELAFFFPQLRTDDKGQTSIDFTMPDALTSWHLHGLAHTTDMMTAHWEENIVAQKELMAELQLPRFLRTGDEAALTASVRNASEVRQKGEAWLDICSADDNSTVKRVTVQFDLRPGSDTVYHVPLKATAKHPVLSVKWIAKGTSCSDGEQRYLPVLSDMQHVTETRSYMLRGDTTLNVSLTNLFANGHSAATGRSLTIEYVTDPIMLVLQTLPALAEPTHNDVLSLAAAYYGGTLARHIASANPDISARIRQMAQQETGDDSRSPLLRNQQLADIVLNETPWMQEALQQETVFRRVADLLDEAQQEERSIASLNALYARQMSDGSFGWYPGMRGNAWMTAEVATLLVRLSHLCQGKLTAQRNMLDRAMAFLEKDIARQVKAMRQEKKPAISLAQLRYLYIYIMYGAKEQNDDCRYLLSLLKKQAADLDREARALAAIVLHGTGEEKLAQGLMPRLHELLRHADGAYLAYPGGTFTSIDRKVQTHVCLMEAIRTVEPNAADLQADMAAWLIRQKRTQDWEQPALTADAAYALLCNKDAKIQAGEWEGNVRYDRRTRILRQPESFFGYVRERIDTVSKPKTLHIERTQTDGSVAWGAVYAQYQIPASMAEAQREGMTIRRDIDRVNGLREGDRVHVRYTITTDRDYEFVCLKAPRPSTAEPVNQLSGYRWQSGTGFYQAMHDASTEYFFDQLPRGTYVIEEDWLLSRPGVFLLPSARLACLYAPEFQAQTAGMTVKVK